MTLFTLGLAIYVIAVTAFIVSENRRPQSAFAWLFCLITLPVAGIVIYILFGRMRGGVGRTRKLLRQTLPGHLAETLAPALAEHERGMARLGATSRLSVRLATMASSASPAILTTRNRVEVLQDADAQYPRLIADLEAARRSIHLQYYIWRPDTLGERLLELLARKVREGVEVRLLYDPVGSIGTLGIPMLFYRRRMRAAGIDMRTTSPLWRVHTISYRNHRKIAVIDGAVGYTGGLNIGDEHIDHDAHGRWRDTHLRIEGTAVRALQAVFAIDWANATGGALLGPEHFPDAPAEGDPLPVQLVTSGPDSDWRAVRQQYFGMVTAARERVRIQTPYFVLEDSLTEALKAAALAGVDVSIMAPARGPDQRLVYWAAATYFADVAAAGVEVLLYEGGFLHAKTVVVDGEVASVGSGNWDIRSFSINYELNALVHDRRVASEVEAAYDRDRLLCRRFDPAAYRAGPALPRFRDSLARLVSPLL